jgi:hypothetical protein
MQCDLARDKVACVPFVKRDCRRPQTGTVSLHGALVPESQQVTKSVMMMPPMSAPGMEKRVA